jgi:hypothetical protein
MVVFSAQSVAQGGREWTPDDVGPSARLRLYRAQASEQFVLSPQDERLPFSLEWFERETPCAPRARLSWTLSASTGRMTPKDSEIEGTGDMPAEIACASYSLTSAYSASSGR